MEHDAVSAARWYQLGACDKRRRGAAVAAGHQRHDVNLDKLGYASEHLVRAWHHIYGLPAVLTNCSNNYGPWQLPEKLIPVVIFKAVAGELIPLYGDGQNVSDWLFVEGHVEALLLAASRGRLGQSYCVGRSGDHGSPNERSNIQEVQPIWGLLDDLRHAGAPLTA